MKHDDNYDKSGLVQGKSLNKDLGPEQHNIKAYKAD